MDNMIGLSRLIIPDQLGNGTRIATWICGDEEDDLRVYGIDRKPNPKKGYLRKEKAWETVFWRV